MFAKLGQHKERVKPPWLHVFSSPRSHPSGKQSLQSPPPFSLQTLGAESKYECFTRGEGVVGVDLLPPAHIKCDTQVEIAVDAAGRRNCRLIVYGWVVSGHLCWDGRGLKQIGCSQRVTRQVLS